MTTARLGKKQKAESILKCPESVDIFQSGRECPLRQQTPETKVINQVCIAPQGRSWNKDGNSSDMLNALPAFQRRVWQAGMQIKETRAHRFVGRPALARFHCRLCFFRATPTLPVALLRPAGLARPRGWDRATPAPARFGPFPISSASPTIIPSGPRI